MRGGAVGSTSFPSGSRHSPSRAGLHVFLSLAQARDPVAFFPLAPFLEHFNALEALEHISLAAYRGRRPQTPML
jgi:hypothetical protein